MKMMTFADVSISIPALWLNRGTVKSQCEHLCGTHHCSGMDLLTEFGQGNGVLPEGKLG